MTGPAPLPSPGVIAREEFRRRRDNALRKVNAGQLRLAQANAHLLPWLAIASAAGAYLPEIYTPSRTITPGQGWAEQSARMLPHEFCDSAIWLRTLSEAAGAAIARADTGLKPDLMPRARALARLCVHFGVPVLIPAAAIAAPAPAPAAAPAPTPPLGRAPTMPAPAPSSSPQPMELPL